MGYDSGGRGVLVAAGGETFTKRRLNIASSKEEEVSHNSLHIPIWIGNVPVEWCWSRLEDVCDGIFDCPHSTPKLSDSGPLMVRTQDVLSGVFRTGQAGHVSEETYRERTKRAEPTHGDLFYSREGTYFGIAAEVPRNYRVCLGQRMVLIRPNSQSVDFHYLRYWLNSPVMEAHIHGFRDGSVAERLNLPTIRILPVLLPSLPEQRAIAHILGTLDDKIELNRRMNETLEEMARTLFKSWFIDFDPVHAKAALTNRTPNHSPRDWTVERARSYLDGMDPSIVALFPDRFVDSELGKIPEGWGVKTLGDLCHKPQYGYTASAKDEPIGPQFLRITDINKKSWIDWDSVPYCEITEENLDKYRLYKGDVLIARMADPGHGVMVEESREVVFASYLIRFHPIQERHTRLLQYWLRSDGYWKLVSERGAGTTRASLNAKVLSGFPIVVPSVSAADIFGRQIARIRARIVANASESRTLAALRDMLLPKLISGELRIKGQKQHD